ncbi:MAG: response regulator [Acidobacteriota bacterium]|nr:response regulator [Acidobacteriota bacterium]
MPALLTGVPAKHKILVVDDEPDIFTLTKLSLKGLRYRGRGIEWLNASSGAEAVQNMRANPDTALMLLDVVMESNSAGLDACRQIRQDLGNSLVRILLRTGQPGSAPERQTIDEFDIDGYLPKAELTSNRLYVAARTALKAWEELVELDRHRSYLKSIHDCVLSLRSFEPLESTLQRILQAAIEICPTDLAVLNLETFDAVGNPRSHLLHLASDPDSIRTDAEAADIIARIRRSQPAGGYVEPFKVHRELGYGFLYLRGVVPDALAGIMLPMLAAHAANALYSVVSHSLMSTREFASYDALTV